jgi:hypothetical protein
MPEWVQFGSFNLAKYILGKSAGIKASLNLMKLIS